MKAELKRLFLKAGGAKALLAASLLACASGAASAAVMTFSGIANASVSMPSYTEDGITAVSTAGGKFWGWPIAGELHLDPSFFDNSDYDFTFGGNAFDLTSVDVSFASIGAVGTWTAYDASNSLVATYVMSGETEHTDTGFAGFSNIYRVHLADTDSHFSIDNLTIDAAVGNVPEPVSMALLGIGMLGMAAGRRRS